MVVRLGDDVLQVKQFGGGEVLVVVIPPVVGGEAAGPSGCCSHGIVSVARESRRLKVFGDVKEDKLLLKKILIVFCGRNKSGSRKDSNTINLTKRKV